MLNWLERRQSDAISTTTSESSTFLGCQLQSKLNHISCTHVSRLNLQISPNSSWYGVLNKNSVVFSSRICQYHFESESGASEVAYMLKPNTKQVKTGPCFLFQRCMHFRFDFWKEFSTYPLRTNPINLGRWSASGRLTAQSPSLQVLRLRASTLTKSPCAWAQNSPPSNL